MRISISHWGMIDNEAMASSSNIAIKRCVVIDDLIDMLPRYQVKYNHGFFRAFIESLFGNKMYYMRGLYVRRFDSSENMPDYDNVRFKRLAWYSRKYRRVCF